MTKRKRVHLQYIWLFTFLFLLAANTIAQGRGKSKKELLNEEYREIEKKMKESYDKGDIKEFEKVINLFKENCCKDNGEDDKVKSKAKARACKEKKRFRKRKVSKEIRANIYRWVALSYFKLNKPERVDIYINKFYKMMNDVQLNKEFEDNGEKIREYFDKGKLKQVTDLYETYCLNNDKAKAGKEKKKTLRKVKKETLIDIYRLVTRSYFARDKKERGENCLKKLRTLRPDEDKEKYWLPIRNMFEKYQVEPLWLMGGKIGINFTTAHPGTRYSILEAAFSTASNPYDKDYIFDFTNLPGSQWGFLVEYALKKNLLVSVQPSSIDLKFRYKKKGEGSGDSITSNYTHCQKLDYVEIPVLLKYKFTNSKSKPYLQIGGFFSYLTLANKKVQVGSKRPETKAIVDLTKLIKRSNWGFLLGTGISLEKSIGEFRFLLEIELNYKHVLNNIINKVNRYKIKELVFGYYDVFDDIKVRNWELSLKILVPIFFKAFKSGR
jgi:hypothetical protein